MDKRYKEIADHYGFDSQCSIAIEEMSELIKSIEKFNRKNGKSGKMSAEAEPAERESVIEEIADVQIMLNQLEYLFECSEQVEDMTEMKLNRQISRISAENAEIG